MKAVLLISLKLDKINTEYFDFSNKLLKDFKLWNYKIPSIINAENILSSLQYDKKVRNGHVRFVLPVGYGEVEIFDNVQTEVIREVLQELY